MRLLFPKTVLEKTVALKKRAIQTQGTKHRENEQGDNPVLKGNLVAG